MKDFYYSVKSEAVAEIKVKGSRFLGYVSSAQSEAAAEAFIRGIRKKHYDATHNCTAWRIGSGDRSLFRYNDDGEPSGTAGRPMLDAIDAAGITDTVCVVTRYYGGTKLGTGGLARAYGETAAAAVQAAGREEHLITGRLAIVFDYDLTGIVMNRIAFHQGSVRDTRYSDHTELVVDVRLSKIEMLVRDLTDTTAGRTTITRIDGNDQ